MRCGFYFLSFFDDLIKLFFCNFVFFVAQLE
ncbi:putative membrane protein, partial [Vibrio harveyi]